MIAGLLAFVSGLRLLFTRAELRAVLWRMLGLLFVLMLLAAVGVYWLADYIAGIWIVAGDAWYWQILGWLAWLLAVMLALVSGVAAFVVLGAAAAAPGWMCWRSGLSPWTGGRRTRVGVAGCDRYGKAWPTPYARCWS